MEILQALTKIAVVTFVVSSMLSIGLAVRGAEIAAPLRRPTWVLRALAANFVLAPVVAWLIGRALPLDSGYELGLLLLAFAAGSPLLPKLAETGRTDVPTATALMVLLMAGSVLVIPLALPLLVAGVEVDPGRIAAPLVILMLAPLLLGMVLRRLVPGTAARLQPALTKTANVGFVAVVLLICGVNLPALIGVLGSGAIGAALLFVIALSLCGWALGEPDAAGRRLLGFATGSRNIGAALVTAGASAMDPKVAVMLIVTGVAGLALLLAIAAWVRRRSDNGL